jgi:hypothetical protein
MEPRMQIDVINLSQHVTERETVLMVAAGVLQMTQHYCPAWDAASAGVKYSGNTTAALAAVPMTHGVIMLLDKDPDGDDTDGVLGYHTEARGKLITKVFAPPVLSAGGSVMGDPQKPNGYSISGTFSHELLEMLGDVNVNKWADGPAVSQGACYSWELCDPVENNGYAIQVADGTNLVTVMMSDFILPAWFDDQNGQGPFSFLDKAPGPFKMSSGGYMVVRDAPGSEQQVFADRASYPAWLLAGKVSKLSRTFKRGVKP